jgi:hypothetical protein
MYNSSPGREREVTLLSTWKDAVDTVAYFLSAALSVIRLRKTFGRAL